MNQRLASIDFLRGVSIILVLFHHARGKAGISFLGFPFGAVGVSIFFAISGFCIHYGYLKNKDFNYRDFFIKRFFRVYPLYFFGILFFVTLGYYSKIFKDIPFESFIYNIFFLQNLVSTVVISPSFWTLAIEFQLYLLFPVFIYLRKKFGFRNALMMISIPQIILYLLAYLRIFDISFDFIHNVPFTFWFNWIIGAYVAERYILGKKAFSKTLTISTLLISFFLFFVPFLYELRYLIGSVLGAVVIDYFINKENTNSFKSLFSRSIITSGLISYSLFVFHQPIMGSFVQRIVYLNSIESKLIIFLISLLTYILVYIFSYFTYLYIEKTSIRFGGKYLKSSTKSEKDENCSKLC